MKARYDRLLDMIATQVSLGSDVLLDMSDAILLLDGCEKLRCKVGNNRVAQIRLGEIRRAEAIARIVAEDHGLRFGELCSGRRDRALVDARHEAIWRIHERCPLLSMPDIARIFGMNHTTVLWVLGRKGAHGKPCLLPAILRQPVPEPEVEVEPEIEVQILGEVA